MGTERSDTRTRREMILDEAEALFAQQGYEATSMEQLLARVGIAKGTLYYHFPSKEAIMDELIERRSRAMLATARAIVEDSAIPGMARLARALVALRVDDGADAALDYMHRPENALMHLKTERLILREVPQILLRALQEDLASGVLDCPHPLVCMEMLVLYANTAFDQLNAAEDKRDTAQRIAAFSYVADRLFGAPPGSFGAALAAAAEGRRGG